jgi:response regulator RpfG family c-di-GMP phosphodiesterase
MNGETSHDERRILIVDDDRAVLEVLAEGLTMLGYDIVTARGADEAFDRVRHEPIALVLSDIEMPGRSGLELLRRIKDRDADLDVIMVTGAVDAGTAVQAIRQGASDYVTKPFNLDEVQIVVERTLEKRRLIRENREYQERLEELVTRRTRELLEKKAEVERLYQELEESLESTLQALVTALDFRDNETQGHSHRVVEYSVLVAERMGVAEPELTWIRRGAILHDVGKIGVSDAVLRKPGKLDASEWEEMRRHPEMGYRMLQHIVFLEPALDIVLCHQERWDGTGYPRRMAGEGIPLGARIFAVVDTFDAMTSDRPYRKALSIEQARDEIRRCAGTQFDPRAAEAFLSIDESAWCRIREQAHERTAALEVQVRRVLG